jgi:hypothetical protein
MLENSHGTAAAAFGDGIGLRYVHMIFFLMVSIAN